MADRMAAATRTRDLKAYGRKGGLASGVVRRLNPRRWRTITFAVPPSDYAQLRAIVERDCTRFSTLAREAVQNFLAEFDQPGEKT